MPSKESAQLKRILHSYHEAGHAVVWHVVGGLIEEVSIASSPAGYGGYCRFGFLVPRSDDQLSPDEWLRRGRIDRRTVTAYYAGMLAMAYYCASYAREDEYLEGSERDDLENIHTLLSASVLTSRSVRRCERHAGKRRSRFSRTIGQLFKR